jgi:peroxiredoxin Q/BCP
MKKTKKTTQPKKVKSPSKPIVKPSVLNVGQRAPQFSLSDHSGTTYKLKDFAGKTVVLFFYPKDNTPGCTIEAKEFSARLDAFAKKGATLIGISGGTAKTKAKFCTSHALTVPLLSDTDFSVSQAFGVYGEKKFMGRVYLGIYRTTFVINGDQRIEAVFEEVSPEGHADVVLNSLL